MKAKEYRDAVNSGKMKAPKPLVDYFGYPFPGRFPDGSKPKNPTELKKLLNGGK